MELAPGSVGSMWGFCVPLARRPSPRLSASSGPFAGFAGVSMGACMQHGVGIDAAVQRWCSNAVMQRCSDAAMLASLVLPGQPQASACPVVIRREARPAPVNFWSGRFSCGALASIGYIVPQRRATVPTCQRRLLGYMLPGQGRYGGTWRE
jgi:hypothetical protein